MAENYGYRLRDLRVEYGDKVALAVDSLEIAEGESVAVVGPSGAGKTTLLRILGLARRPTLGCVEIGAIPSTGLSSVELRRARVDIGFVHQDFRLVPNLRVLQNVLCGRLGRMSLLASLRALTIPAAADVRAVHGLLERVGIGDKLYQRCDNLSGGEQQRVAVARALFQQPRILLADEPTSNVDPARANETVRLLGDICAADGLTFCASMHNIEMARALFPRIIGLRSGRVVFDRPTDAITDADIADLYRLPIRAETETEA